MNLVAQQFMFTALCQYLENKGLLDSAEFRSLCHAMMEKLPAEMRTQIEPTIAKMSVFSWKPDVV